ncbi:MAG TPA: hypothetical protein VGJ30_08075 [Candidatus Angelobacter sp.]|jgi:hypothetical protein
MLHIGWIYWLTILVVVGLHQWISLIAIHQALQLIRFTLRDGVLRVMNAL